jgi:GTP-binding protein HflX
VRSAPGEAVRAEASGSERVLVLVPVLPARGGDASLSAGQPGPAADAEGGRRTRGRKGFSIHSPEDRLSEARGLAEAINLNVIDGLIVPVPNPKAGTLFGSGKVEEIAGQVADHDIGLVIVDHQVSPVQQRNLEKAWNTKVLDRTGLILEIFGARARTREGRLQVELAHLSYQKGRLVRAWTHLERQRGGGGFLGGPGEAQIELDRRMLQDRIDAIRKDLEQVVRTRELHRAGRRKVPYPVVAIVGYTNAGKSTLFNRLTGAEVLAMDQVFATLDPTMREVKLASGRRVILSDTVGFISDLPTMLVAAFRATLEEVIDADLILHVRDISHKETQAQADDVNQVLESLGIDLTPAEAENAARFKTPRPVLVSAMTGEGLAGLLDAIDVRLGVTDEIVTVPIAGGDGKLRAWLYENTDVVAAEEKEDGSAVFTVRIPADKKGRLMGRLGRAG